VFPLFVKSTRHPDILEYGQRAFSLSVESIRLPPAAHPGSRIHAPPSSICNSCKRNSRTDIRLNGHRQVRAAYNQIRQLKLMPTDKSRDAPTARHRASPRYALGRCDLFRDRFTTRYVTVRQGQSKVPRKHRYHAARISCERNRNAITLTPVNNTQLHSHIIYWTLNIVYNNILHHTLYISTSYTALIIYKLK